MTSCPNRLESAWSHKLNPPDPASVDLEQLTPPAPSLTREGEEDVEFSVYFTHTDACTPVTWNLHYVIHEMDWCAAYVFIRVNSYADVR